MTICNYFLPIGNYFVVINETIHYVLIHKATIHYVIINDVSFHKQNKASSTIQG